MKKLSLKNVLSVSGAVLFTFCCIWMVAQSNANDDASIMIDTDRYTATQHIQEVHLNQKDSATKVGIKNLSGVTLGVGVISGDRVGGLNNITNSGSSVVAGVGNRNFG